MKTLMWALLISAAAQSQTGIKPLTAVSIPQYQAKAVTSRVQEAASRYTEILDRNTGYQSILEEHGLAQSGATQTGSDDSVAMAPASQIISGSCGSSGSRYFIILTLTDVASGRELCSKHATVMSYDNLLTVAGTVTKALLQRSRLEDDERVTTVRDTNPIIMGTDKVIIETHVFQHAPGTYSKPTFIPCQFCGGTGKVPCRGSELCPTGYRDCPACNVNSMYKGSETHGQYLTGHWVQ